MNYLSIENLSKTYGIKALFDNISFGLEKNQKTALIAKNGAGKSTLLKIIAGVETMDSGKVTFRKEVTFGYLSQDQSFDENLTVREIINDSDNPMLNAIKQYNDSLVSGKEDDMNNAFELMTNLHAWDYEVKINQVLTQLKIADITQPYGQLSGGQQKRIALAKILLENPDMMLLDEPTNHLDLEMIEWLENFLEKENTTILMVTHDRYFLERVCNDIVELDGGNLYRYKGNYSYFIEKKAEREEVHNVNTSKAKSLMRKELEWMRKMPKARTTKSKSRIDEFYNIKDKASKGLVKDEMSFNIRMERLGTKIVEMHKVKKAYDDKVILNGFDYLFKRGEKVGIVGNNGVGKSTFLNMITGETEVDGGKVVIGDTVKFGFYTQAGMQFKDDKRVIEVVKDIADHIPVEGGKGLSASQFLERFLFPTKMHYQYVGKLSGGEKRRLYLLTVLIHNPNFLILDEPTNDLDIFTLNVLEDYLQSFQGSLIIVSHDRYFMDKIVDHMFVFQGEGNIKDLIGNYSVYLDKKSQLDAETVKIATEKKERIKAPKEKIKLNFKEQKEFNSLEKEIAKLESERDEITESFSTGSLSGEEFEKKSKRLSEVVGMIEEKTARWMELAEFA